MFFWVFYSIQGFSFAEGKVPSGFRTPCYDGWAECFENQEIQGSRFIYDNDQLRHDVRARVSFWRFRIFSKSNHLVSFPEEEIEEIKETISKPKRKRQNIVKVEKEPEPSQELEESSWNCTPLEELEDAALAYTSRDNIAASVKEVQKESLYIRQALSQNLE